MPAINRNEADVSAAHSKSKYGPNALIKYGPNDWAMWIEVANLDAALTNWSKFGQGSSPWNLQLFRDADDLPPLPASTWENGELAITDVWYDEYDKLWVALFHGGNNAGPRQIGLMFAPPASRGRDGWYRYSGNPILANGGSGASDEVLVADAKMFRFSASNYRMVYVGVRASDSAPQLHLATSSDRRTFSKYGSNPILTATGTGNVQNGVPGLAGFVDSLGTRVHGWYVGKDGTNVRRILYGYSDDQLQTWTTDPSQVVLNTNPGGGGGDPDLLIGDTIEVEQDEGIVVVNTGSLNISAYGGDSRGRFDSITQYYMPSEAASAPVRPGRCFPAATDRMDVNAAGKLLNSTVGCIYAEAKHPPSAGATPRHIYTEYAAFNKQIFLRINTDGSLEGFWRTPTGACQMVAKIRRWDDGEIFWAGIRRTATNAFELVANGVVLKTDTTTVGTDATAMEVCWGNWGPTIGVNENFQGWLRRGITIAGSCLTLAQMTALWNDGKGGTTCPITPTCSVLFGSGGSAGPDAAQDGATYGASVGAGSPIVVDAAPNPQLVFPSAVHRPTAIYAMSR
jgi:hypothetical protein